MIDDFYDDLVTMEVRAQEQDPEYQRAVARQQYRDYRRVNRPFRSAFRGGLVAGERQRRILGHVGQCHARGMR